MRISNNPGPQAPKNQPKSPGDFERIDKDFGTILDGYREVDASLKAIDEATQLQPPSLSNIKDAQLLLLGASAGAGLGGGFGLASNLITSWAAQPSIDVVSQRQAVTRPVLLGHTERREEVTKDVTKYDQNGNPYQGTQLVGWKVIHEPSFKNEKVGESLTQRAEINDGGISNPALDALGGALWGAGIGTALAAGTVVARKVTGQGDYLPGQQRQTGGDLQVVGQMAATGAVVGGGVGALSGLLASSNAVSKTIVQQTPQFQVQVVGQIPADYPVSVYQSNPTRPGLVDVSREVPVMEGGVLGVGRRLKLSEERQEVVAGGGLSVASGLVSGAVAGAGIGVAAGVLTNILRKTL